MNNLIFIILAGYIMDLIFGDPQWHWHPVRIIGRQIGGLEKKLNTGKFNKFPAGIALVILVVGTTVILVWGSLQLVRMMHPVIYYAYSAMLIYFSLSVKSLAIESRRVYTDLEKRDLTAARKSLSMIVGRDTDNLEEKEMIRATLETVAESTMDGIVAPLFYAFLGGPILAWAYKAINTLDSMVGYRSERFIEFGKPAAKLDGWVNFIPAKITSFLIVVSGWLCGKWGFTSFKWMVKYFFKSQENNGAAAEAAMAGALKIQLGGKNFYNSLPVEKPLIGDKIYPLEIKHIRESIRIVYLCSFLFLTIGLLFLMNVPPAAEFR